MPQAWAAALAESKTATTPPKGCRYRTFRLSGDQLVAACPGRVIPQVPAAALALATKS
jgi:hypothetical protein